MGPLPNNAKVSELIINGNWNSTLVWAHFDRTAAREILSIHLPENNAMDRKIWKPSRNGEYTIKSGYWIAQESNTTAPAISPSFWKSFWKQEILPNWKMFIWKIMHRALPVAHELEKRKIQIETQCKLCNSAKKLWSISFEIVNSPKEFGSGHWVIE